MTKLLKLTNDDISNFHEYFSQQTAERTTPHPKSYQIVINGGAITHPKNNISEPAIRNANNFNTRNISK